MISKRTTESPNASSRNATKKLQKQRRQTGRLSKVETSMKPQQSRLTNMRNKTKQLFGLCRSGNHADLSTTFVSEHSQTPAAESAESSTAPTMKPNRSTCGVRFLGRIRRIFGVERKTNNHLDDCIDPDLIVSDCIDSCPAVPECVESGSLITDCVDLVLPIPDRVDSGLVVQDDDVLDDDESDYSDDGEPNERDENDRRNFKAIRNISRAALEDLVLTTVYPENAPRTHTCRVSRRKEGSFHHCVFLDIDDGQQSEQAYVLRIPAHGLPDKWQEKDAFMLRNEAVLMQHIRHHTECPVPEVISFDETLNNPIEAPYILMKKVEGMSALDMWQGNHLFDPPALEEAHLNADEPYTLLEAIRVNFIKSLAIAMSHLHKLEFANTGVPVFEHFEDEQPSSIGPAYVWHTRSTMQPITGIGPFPTSREFFDAGVKRRWDLKEAEADGTDPDDEELLEHKGIGKILNMVVDSKPFAAPHESLILDSPDQESASAADLAAPKFFVLRHDDLDLQNILVDYKGNVTGIIDWDGCMAVPRCIGYASLPTFLRRDWLPGHSMTDWPFVTWSTQRYRNAYSVAMSKACAGLNCDAKLTKKSAIYQALFAVLYEDEECPTVLGHLLGEFDGFRRVDFYDLCVRLGKGWPAAEKVLKEKITHLLTP